MTQIPTYAEDSSSWPETTRRLVELFPLQPGDLIEATVGSWNAVFDSTIGGHRIGAGIRPAPQIMSFLLHELIPLRLHDRFPDDWRIGQGNEKDVVCINDDRFSFEIKASSHRTDIFGNRSYAQPPAEQAARSGKVKDGYYLAINFQKFMRRDGQNRPQLTRIRFGWLGHSDWVPQRAPTGQQAHLAGGVAEAKLVELWSYA